MRKRHVMLIIGLEFCSAISTFDAALAQMPSPAAKSPDGAALFKQQCATCHTTSLSDAPRQGPPLAGIIGRRAGKLDGFHYSSGLAQAGFTWDDEKLDAWLSNPQDLVPGSVMAYRQTKAETRAAIITYLKELH
jgi:cytochrome c